MFQGFQAMGQGRALCRRAADAVIGEYLTVTGFPECCKLQGRVLVVGADAIVTFSEFWRILLEKVVTLETKLDCIMIVYAINGDADDRCRSNDPFAIRSIR
jgi:hypothetical protein